MDFCMQEKYQTESHIKDLIFYSTPTHCMLSIQLSLSLVSLPNNDSKGWGNTSHAAVPKLSGFADQWEGRGAGSCEWCVSVQMQVELHACVWPPLP